MKLATTAIVLVSLIATLIAGSTLVSAHRSPRGFHQLPRLLGATARLVAAALVPLDGSSLLAAAQDLAAAQTNVRHRIVTGPALPGGQLRVHTHRQTWWR